MTRIPLVVTFNRTLPNLDAIVRKYWKILHVNPEFKNVFSEPPILAFKRNKNLRDFIGSNRIAANQVLRPKNVTEMGQCSPCMSKTGSLCCSQINKTSTFKSMDGNTFASGTQ